jgi:hypothetical protein
VAAPAPAAVVEEEEPDEEDDSEKRDRSDPVFEADHDFDGDDPSDDEDDAYTQRQALDDGGRDGRYHVAKSSLPAASAAATLKVGQSVLFKWDKQTGWAFATISRCYPYHKGKKKFNPKVATSLPLILSLSLCLLCSCLTEEGEEEVQP